MPPELTLDVVAVFGDESFDSSKPPAGMLRAVHFPTLMWVDKRTPDGRLIMRDGFAANDFPKSFMFQFKYLPAHLESVPVGRIDKVSVMSNGKVEGWGWIADSEEGQKAAALIGTKTQRGVSVDLSASKVNVRWNDKTESIEIDLVESRLRGATGVAFPAFPDAKAGFEDIDLAASIAALPELLTFDVEEADGTFNVEYEVDFETTDLAAAMAPADAPPVPQFKAAHFAAPDAGEAYPLRVNPDGRVHGYVAKWGECHVGIEGRCITPPRSRTNYSVFASRLGNLDNGETVWVGSLVLGAKHAPGHLDWQATAEYYGNACRAWADVSIGEDQFGIWISGSVRPGVTPEDVHAGAMSAVSGHWKPYKGALELMAVLSVNAPGYPIPRPSLFADTSGLVDLQAAGVMEQEPVIGGEHALAARVDRLISMLEQEHARREAAEILAAARASA